jgi:hypothetical protein
MSNNWTSNKKFDKKKQATQHVVDYFSNLSDNGSAVLMPSTTGYDIEALYCQNKINDSTFLYIVDNLEGSDLKNCRNKNQKEYEFKNKFKTRLKEITGTDKLYLKNKNNLILGRNIQDFPLSVHTGDKHPHGCDVIYADTCGTYSQKMINWIVEKPTIQALRDNGIFAITMLLTRKKIEGDFSSPKSDPDLIWLGKNKDINSKKMFAIANDVENLTFNILQSKALIYYEDNVHSPMGVFIFEKHKN